MKKLLLSISLFSLIQAAQEANSKVIEGASYFVYVPASTYYLTKGRSGAKDVCFYTFNGDLLKTIPCADCYYPEEFLDSSAPKPQPVYCRVLYWPAISIGLWFKVGRPGYFIIFYDKNDNLIDSFCCDKEEYQKNKKAYLKQFKKDLDLSILFKKVNCEKK